MQLFDFIQNFSQYDSAKIVAVSVFAICYLVLFSEKVNRAVVALLGAAVLILTGILTQTSALDGIDFNTLSLLIGMMIIIGTSEKSGLYEYISIWAVKKVKANPRGLLIVLAVVTAVFSAFLDNVTTVLLIAPITIKITKQLQINPYPYLILEIFTSNIGGTATLIGDPPNILIGSALHLSFMDFVKELTPIVVSCLLIVIFIFDLSWKKTLIATTENRLKIMLLNEKEVIRKPNLLKKSLFVLFIVILGFITAEETHLANGVIALAGAGLILFLYTLGKNQDVRDQRVEKIFADIDWTTIFFFTGLFVIVYGLEETGILKLLGEKFLDITNNNLEKITLMTIWVSAILSSIVDNIPFVATMIPMLKSMEESIGGREIMMPAWWALSLGACFGGNGTIIGASANVIIAGIAAREGHPIRFLSFMKWSIPIMILTIAISTIWLKIQYF
ncbi:MAG: ArsB/NhaD family transporter [Alphaproteobacteria bacterium]|nr:ArsB/NhaD family transporter [Alphaproteobacteria bacterium]